MFVQSGQGGAVEIFLQILSVCRWEQPDLRGQLVLAGMIPHQRIEFSASPRGD